MTWDTRDPGLLRTRPPSVTAVVAAGPTRAAGAALLLAAAVLVAVAAAADTPGRLLALPAALVLAGLGLRDLLLRPVLRADTEALEVVVGLRRHRFAWSQVQRLRLVTDRRTPLLELDLGDTLVVLTRARLGRPPDLVLAELLDLHR